MIALTEEFVESCPVEGGIRMRGMEMTRIEVFVDAAFAFSVTMLVISFDAIPTSFAAMIVAIKGIPAFIAAVAQLMWIWHTHNKWSKRFGLDDAITVVLSTSLLVVVLIYIYPLRVMAQGMFSWFTNGFLPANFQMGSQELSAMFVFLGIGFMALCIVFILMYRYAASRKDELRLSEAELHEVRSVELVWSGVAVIGLISIILARALPLAYVPFSGFAFMLIAAWVPWIRMRRNNSSPERKENEK